MDRKINIFWVDDELSSKLENQPVYTNFLKRENVEFTGFPNSDELFSELEKPGAINRVDGVIFDFNMSNKSEIPSGDTEKSGFLDILRGMEKYIAKGIPFYLWSKKEPEEIISSLRDNKDLGKEWDIFRKHFLDGGIPRFYSDEDSFKNTIRALKKEVEEIDKPETKLRLEYPEAYEAANKISDKCWTKIVDILTLTPDSPMWGQKENMINPVRCELDVTLTSLGIPMVIGNADYGIKLDALATFIQGSHQRYKLNPLLEDKILANGIKILVPLLQDGSHKTETLKYGIQQYITDKQDIHLLKFIAHSFINILIWANKAISVKEKGDWIFQDLNESKNLSNENSINRDMKENLGVRDKDQAKSSIIPTHETEIMEGKLEVDNKGFIHIGDFSIGGLKIDDNYIIKQYKINSNTYKIPYKYFVNLNPNCFQKKYVK